MLSDTPCPKPERLTIRSNDADLIGTLHRPQGAPRAAVVLHGATGVPHRFYRHFAEWAAKERDLAVLTYDYRDFGASASRSIRESRATMVDWGVHDQSAAQAKLERTLPGIPVWVVGHSLGAMCLPFQDGASRVDRLFAVASGPVNMVRDHPWPYRALAASFWFGHGAFLDGLLGYLPSWAGVGSALPSGVYRQWRRWCTSKGFYDVDIGRSLPTPNAQAFRGRARFVAVSDDPMVPPHCVWRLMQRYPDTSISQVTLRPEAFDLPRIGHVGVLGKASRSVWPVIIDS